MSEQSEGDTAWGLRAAPAQAPGPAPRQGLEDGDSYEAAMRAADALFARAPSKPRPDERPRAAVADDQPSDPRDMSLQAPPSAPEDVAKGAPERFGRVLRAIDEPEVDPFAQMEAERAPKKRGRKPGSKNKPKPGLAVVAALEIEPEPVAIPRAAAEAPMQSSPAPYRPLNARRPSASREAYKAERFSWVRTRLGPGEQWKRRLPKVIW